MPSQKHHGKDGHKTKDLKCESGHSKCTPGNFESHALRDSHQHILWEVRWWPCRKNDAVAYMKKKHGYTYPKPAHHKSHHNHQPKKHGTQSSLSSNQRYQPGQVASGQQNIPAQAATRRQNQHHPMPPPPPPMAYAPSAPMPPEVPQQQQSTPNPRYMSQVKQGRIGAWMDGRVDWDQDMDSNELEDMAPLQCFARAQDMAPGPAMPAHQATPVGQQQLFHHHSPESGQMPPPYATMPLPETSVPGPALAPIPVTSSHYAPSDGRRHGHRRHHHSSREPGAGPGQDPQPLSTISPGPSMPAGMVSPTGMTVPPVMPSAQGARGERHQRHRRGASGVSHHEQAPLSLTAQPPPPTMRESMASMAEEAIPAHPTQSLALRPGPGSPPGMPMPPGCPHPSTQYLDLCAEVQEASRVLGTQDMQFPMGPPQAGIMPIAAAGAFYISPPPMNLPMPELPHPQSTRRAPRQGQQQPPPGMSSRASVAVASAAGTPGPQAMALRPPPGGLSGPPAISPNPRRQPPPTSMPPFPGTGPSTPGSMDLARAPPPGVPMPPSFLGEDD